MDATTQIKRCLNGRGIDLRDWRRELTRVTSRRSPVLDRRAVVSWLAEYLGSIQGGVTLDELIDRIDSAMPLYRNGQWGSPILSLTGEILGSRQAFPGWAVKAAAEAENAVERGDPATAEIYRAQLLAAILSQPPAEMPIFGKELEAMADFDQDIPY